MSLGVKFVRDHFPRWLAIRLAQVHDNQGGASVVTKVIYLALGILIVGTIIPAMWPVAVATLTDVSAMNGTDTGTTMIQALWPVGIMVAAIGLGVWLIFYAMRQLGVFGASKGGW